mgnify:CR=1 FL=1
MLHKQDMSEIKAKEEQQILQLKQEFESKFKESEEIYSHSKNESERASTIFEERLKQIENEQED